MMALAELMGGGVQPKAGPDRRGLPEAQIATLREAAACYAAPCPFRAGDLVTPREGFNLKGFGQPHVVLELIDPPIRFLDPDDPGSFSYGERSDMRIANVVWDGQVIAHMVESWRFEAYRGDGA